MYDMIISVQIGTFQIKTKNILRLNISVNSLLLHSSRVFRPGFFFLKCTVSSVNSFVWLFELSLISRLRSALFHLRFQC